MSQKYNDNRQPKRPKPQDSQLEILNIYAFCQKIQQSASGPQEKAAGIMSYLSLRTTLSGSKKWAVGA